jgi:hypothetical protein
VASIWAESIARSLDQALDLLATAVRGCTDERWQTPMWPTPDDESEPSNTHFRRFATPWGVAWHALETFDYDLNGDFAAWTPPPPFTDHPHWRDLATLSEPWSRHAILGYVGYCRRQARESLERLTDELAASPLPRSHRYGGQPHAWIIASLVGHTTEHAAQIGQFTARRIAPDT